MSNVSQLKMTRAEAVAQALRTGEISAARIAVAGMIPTVTMTSRGQVFSGREGVQERLAGLWPLMLALRSADWSYDNAANGAVIAHATFGSIGASPDWYDLNFEYDDAGFITKIVETFKTPAPSEPTQTMSVIVQRRINNALAEGKPITLSYVNDAGEPEISLRGSIQVYSPSQLGAWIRVATSGLVRSIEAGRPVSMLYRDPPTRARACSICLRKWNSATTCPAPARR
jgi:hypothetical protein